MRKGKDRIISYEQNNILRIDLDFDSFVYYLQRITGKYSSQGDKVIIIVPKEYHDLIRKLRNPLLINAEEILE